MTRNILRAFCLSILALLICVGASAQERPDAPDFKFVCFNDCPKNLSDLTQERKPVIVKFWSLSCRICLKEIPYFLEAAKKKNIDVYFVNVGDDAGPIRSYVQKRKVIWPILFDRNKKIARRYKVEQLPKTIYIDKNGKVLATVVGADSQLTIFQKYAKILLEE